MPTKTLACLLLMMSCTAAIAHDGHGLTGSHWHASDSLGFIVLAVVVATLVRAVRRK
jgi:hypothetical protein